MRDAKKASGASSPRTRLPSFKDLRKGLEINRNRDMDWVRTLEKKSSERRIGLWAEFETPTALR
jgi:putative protease